MMSHGWRGDALAATTRGRCAGYVQSETVGRRPGLLCKRQGTLTLTVGNLLPTGPFCWQHGRKHQDRATAAAIGTDRLVRLEVIK